MKKQRKAQKVQFLDETEKWQHGKTIMVLISGKAGVGKTTSAHILKRLVEDQFMLVDIDSFAKSVKETARKKGWNGKKDESGRRFLQEIGRIGREKDKDHWVNTVINRALNPIPKDVVLIDDWRFPNERDTIKNKKIFKVITVRIHSPEREKLKGKKSSEDISENALPYENDKGFYDFFITNNGDMRELEAKLSEVMEEIVDG